MTIWILEDEEYILDGIFKFICVNFPGKEVLPFKSAESAVEKLKSCVPDIVVTDIVMGEFSGLDFLAQLRKSGCDAKVIVLSGHENFSFAQRAIDYGAIGYLLKPVNRKKLIDLISKCIDERLKSKGKEKLSSEKYIARMLMVTKEANFKSLPAPNEVLEDLLKRYIVVTFPKTVISIREELIECIKLFNAEYVCTIFQDYVVLLSNIDRELLKISVSSFRYKIPKGSSIGCSNFFSGINNLYKAFLDSISQIVVVCDDYEEKQKLQTSMVLKDFYRTVSSGELRELPMAISPLLDSSHNYEPVIKDTIFKIYDVLYSYLIPYAGDAEIPEKVDITSLTYNEIKFVFFNLFRKIYAMPAVTGYSKKCLICDVATDVFDEDIANSSLESVCAVMGINSCYFCTMFSEVNGFGFKQYMVNSRIKKAQALMEEKNLSISEIAKAVGYSDIKHFRKIFKQVTGISPIEYQCSVEDS